VKFVTKEGNKPSPERGISRGVVSVLFIEVGNLLLLEKRRADSE